MIKRLFHKSLELGLSQTARALYWVFSGNVVAIVLAFFTTILIARFLTKEEFGIYLALYSFAALLADLGDVGIGPSLSSFIPPLLQSNRHLEVINTLGTAFYLEILISGVISLIVLVIAPFLAHTIFGQTTVLNIVITVGIMFSILLFNFATLALTAQKKFSEAAVVNISSSFFRLLLLVFIALVSKLTLFTILMIYFLAPLTGWVYSLIHFKTDFLKTALKWGEIKKIFHFSGYLGLQKIFIAISSRLDFLMVVPLASAYEAGVYGAASRISQVYPFFVSSFSQVMAPKFAEYSQGKAALGFFKKSGLVVVLFLVSLSILYVYANPFILLLFPKYNESIPVFKGLLIAMVSFIIATPFVSFVIYTLKKPSIIAWASFLQLLVIFLANLLLIPHFGRMGPVIGIGLGNLAVCVISVIATVYYLK